MQGRRKFISDISAAVIAILSIGAVLFPLLQSGLKVDTDGLFHLARIESLYLALKEGVFPAKVHFAAAYTYGYGSGFFYPDFRLCLEEFKE